MRWTNESADFGLLFKYLNIVIGIENTFGAVLCLGEQSTVRYDIAHMVRPLDSMQAHECENGNAEWNGGGGKDCSEFPGLCIINYYVAESIKDGYIKCDLGECIMPFIQLSQ